MFNIGDQVNIPSSGLSGKIVGRGYFDRDGKIIPAFIIDLGDKSFYNKATTFSNGELLKEETIYTRMFLVAEDNVSELPIH